MKPVQNRSFYEKNLAKALSRHIGYTTGAYDLFRIANVTLAFKGELSKYQFELIKELIQKSESNSGKIGEDYAIGILDFCVGLNFLQRIPSPNQVAFSKLALTPLGLAYRAANKLGLNRLKQLILIASVLQSDADNYIVLLEILKMIGQNKDQHTFHNSFEKRTAELLNERGEWINRVFTNSILRRRIADLLQWANIDINGIVTPKPVKKDFARHHSAPRKGWAEALAHYDPDRKDLTSDGKELLERFQKRDRRFFWLGPKEECQEALRIPSQFVLEGPFEPAWNVIRPVKITDDKVHQSDLLSNVVDFMQRAYNYLKFAYANQAPLDAIKPYIYFLELEAGVRINEDELIKKIFQKYSHLFAGLSKRHGGIGYYQLRTRSNK